MKPAIFSIFAALAWVMANPCAGDEPELLREATNLAGKAYGKSKALLVVAHIKTVLADRKDIRSRYIRVRFDGETLELAGFVPDSDTGKKIEEIAGKIATPKTARSFWSVQYDLEDMEPYTTRVGEQASDAMLKAKVIATLKSSKLEEQLSGMAIQAVDVRHGKARIYIIADSPSTETDVEKYLKDIHGIVSVRCAVLKTFQ